MQSASDSLATAITGKAVHGLGGVGKTRLAVEYAWQHAEEFSAVLFVTADSPAALRRELAELTGPLVLNLPEHSATEEDVRVAAALRWLHEHPGWCLILDDVDSEDAAEHVEQLLTHLSGGHVLITSRLARWSACVETLELDVLAKEDAARLLLDRTASRRRKHPGDETDAAHLAAELGGLALALEQAAAYINRMRITLSEYLQRWHAHDRAVQSWHDQRQMKYPRSVAVTWQTTLDQLGPAEVAVLNVLAWFAPEPVPLSVFADPDALATALGVHKEPANADGAANAEQTIEPQEYSFRQSLALLADFSMIRWDAVGETVSMHRVVQEIVRTQQTEPTLYLGAALRLVDQAQPRGNPADVRTWPGWGPLRPHVALMTSEADRMEIAEPTSRLMSALGMLLFAKALHSEAEPLMRRALAIDEQLHGLRHPNVARHLNNLAWLLRVTNRLAEAEPLMRRALAIAEQAYGLQHPNVAIHLNNLASLLQDTNRLAEAEPLIRRGLAIDEQAYEPRHPHVARDLNNLAWLLRVTDRLAEAEPLMRRALAIDEQSYGPEHPNVAIHLNNLALLLQATNRLAEAEPLIRRALAIDEQSYGAEHPQVAVKLNNLALLLRDTNRLAEAEPLIRRALAIDEQTLGPQHPDVAGDINNLAQLLKDANRMVEAEALMRRALVIDERSYGPQHANVAIDLNNLAALFKATNRLREAEPLMRRALLIDEQLYGLQHPAVARNLNNLAVLLQATDRLAEAESLIRRALVIDEQSYGPQHPNVAIHLNNLALLLQTTNKTAEAEPLMRRHIAVFVRFGKLSGHEHPRMQAALVKYRETLLAIKLPDDEIDRRLQDATTMAGPLSPITPEVERLLGPAQPVTEVLAALDRQYQAAGKPAIYFLPLDQPITPHLDQLLGPSPLNVPLDQPIAPHLDELLGPAKSVQEVLDELDAQYRQQGKPAIWFLPLTEPISPHLDELLGPSPELNQE